MQKKLTISIAESVYNDLYAVIGKRKISKFIENLIKPYIVGDNLSLAYQEMAQDAQREIEACQWTEGLIHHDFS
jgi:predicted CopG family antitoxin